MRPIHIDTLPAVAWKNGGGVTRNIAVSPEGAGFDDFIWRVSIADVKQSGKFSVFPNVDRTIVLLEGDGMMLHSEDGGEFALTTPFEPHAFSGESRIDACLLGSATRDFNVMVRRGRAKGTVEVWNTEGRLPRNFDEAVLFCARGVFQMNGCSFSAGEALRISGAAAGMLLIPHAPEAVVMGALIDLSERN